jgi:hypothetical protein
MRFPSLVQQGQKLAPALVSGWSQTVCFPECGLSSIQENRFAVEFFNRVENMLLWRHSVVQPSGGISPSMSNGWLKIIRQ